ncbi:MAG: hypothetical protein LBR89_01450 [Holosporales bacterium]|jgi:hypothetical protein|nr:hypothetical protein [Holosporales bacterium]
MKGIILSGIGALSMMIPTAESFGSTSLLGYDQGYNGYWRPKVVKPTSSRITKWDDEVTDTYNQYSMLCQQTDAEIKKEYGQIGELQDQAEELQRRLKAQGDKIAQIKARLSALVSPKTEVDARHST